MSAWLIDTLLYTGLLIGLVLVLRRPAGRFFGPQLAYGLWALPFIRLLLPPIVLPARLAPEPAQAPAMAPTEWVPVAMEAPVETIATVAAAPPTVLAPPTWEWTDLIAPAASIWAGVALAFLAWRIVTYQRMRRELLKGARPVGEIGRIRLIETPALAAPVAFGVLDKVIGLPPLFMAQHDVAARDLAIAHEVAHHRGHDLLANFAAQALLALHWFNPLAWYGWRAMRRDQEAACDARVLAGRDREERLRYAALIAGIATGPRSIAFKGALAAPMACPVLGERSIVHRLRSLSMSETSRRRRWFGRSLMAASALALPLTASISYAAASAQPAPPGPPPAPSAELAPVPATPVAPPEASEAHDGNIHTYTFRSRDRDGEPVVRHFTWRGPQPPQFQWRGEWDSEEFQQQMEEFQGQMEQFREQFAEQHGQDWEQWAEQYSQHWEQWGEQFAEGQERRAEQQAEAQAQRAEALAETQERRAEAQAWASAASLAPQVVADCADENPPARATRTEDGRQQIVICDKRMNRFAYSSLRNARNSIANNSEISPEVRNEILEDLDEEIVRIERDDDD